MDKLVIYQKPTCSTCQRTLEVIKGKNIDFKDIDYFKEPLSCEELKRLIDKMGISAEDLLRKKDDKYKELIAQDGLSDDQSIIQAMIDHPQLMERPIVEYKDKAILARPFDKVHEIL